MRRRRFIKAGLATCGAGLLNVNGSILAARTNGTPPDESSTAEQYWGESMSIRSYLVREAVRITRQSLSSYTDATAWNRVVPERRRQFMEMMGLGDLPPYGQRPPLNATVTGVLKRGKYRIEKLYYESLPKLFITANLYIPNGLNRPAPAVLYTCGHAAKQKTHYQALARRFAELGFVCLLINTIQGAEEGGYHHGPYDWGWFQWYSRGYTPGGVELLNGIRGLDLLVQRSDVDPKRIGVTGVSGGGSYSWWIAAGDERIRISAPVCGTSTLASFVYDRTIDSNCDCQWWTNSYKWDMTDVGALIAPRPLMIADSSHDIHFTPSSTREVYQKLKRFYTLLGAPENVSHVVAPGAHSYHPLSRTAVFSFFIKHLQGKDIPPDEVGDIDQRPQDQESEEALRVFVNGSPPGNRVQTIQDTFVKLAEPPRIENAEELKKTRANVIAALNRISFAAFPPTPPPISLHIEHVIEAEGGQYHVAENQKGATFHFASEEGWRLRGSLHLADTLTKPVPAVMGLRAPGDGFMRTDWIGGITDEFLRPIQAPWAKVSIELRGTGGSVWGEALEWHLRRAFAWTGRTLASMWVYDTLRALACVRQLPQVDGRKIALAARGQMTVVALYAALLDGHVNTLFLENPPATQNAPSRRDGQGDAVEILGCLRVTDLPQVAGLLYPTELVFVGDYPSTYEWAQNLYQRLGAAEQFRRVHDMGDWRPI